MTRLRAKYLVILPSLYRTMMSVALSQYLQQFKKVRYGKGAI